MDLAEALNDPAVLAKAEDLRPLVPFDTEANPDGPPRPDWPKVADWQPGAFELAWAVRELHADTIPPASFDGNDVDELIGA